MASAILQEGHRRIGDVGRGDGPTRAVAETSLQRGATRAEAETSLRRGATRPVSDFPLRRGALVTGSPAATQRGFTLIEVIVAFALLAFALTLLLGTLSGSTKQVRWSAEAGRAAIHAQSLLDRTGVGEALQPGRREGTFEGDDYRWTLDITPYVDPTPSAQPTQAGIDPSAPKLLQLVLAVRWGEGDPHQRLDLHSLRLVAPDVNQSGALP